MTLIIGIQCEDGIVLGADGAATLGTSLGVRTVRQSVKKLTKIGECVAIGTSGPVGLGQRFGAALQKLWDDKKLSGKSPNEVMTILQKEFWQFAELEFRAVQVTGPILGQAALESAISCTIVVMPIAREARLIQFNHQCSPELASHDLPFVAIGSGQPLGDMFLAFLRRIFWKDHRPKVTEGVLATVWALTQAIKTNTGGVSDPIQVMTLEKVNGDWKVEELAEDDLSEHYQAIKDAERTLTDYRTYLNPEKPGTPPPEPA
jgi:20S proteasome alpha/beta subunit